MLELVEFDIPELLNVYLKFVNEEVSPVGVLKRGGLKRVANGDLRKTSSLPVRSDRTAKEFGELKLISGDPTIGSTIVLSIPLRYILGTIGKF